MPAEKAGLFLHADCDPAVFPFFRFFDTSIQQQGGQLHAVADAKHRNARPVKGRVDPGRAFVMDAGGTAGKNDTPGTAGKDILQRRVPGDDF